MIMGRPRRAEHCHHRVPGELVHDSAMGADNFGHGRQVPPDHLRDLPRREPFSQGGKPADVGEHDGRLELLLQRQRGRRCLHQLGDLRRQEGRQRSGKKGPLLHLLEPKPQPGLGSQVGDELLAGRGERFGRGDPHSQRPQQLILVPHPERQAAGLALCQRLVQAPAVKWNRLGHFPCGGPRLLWLQYVTEPQPHGRLHCPGCLHHQAGHTRQRVVPGGARHRSRERRQDFIRRRPVAVDKAVG
jgi:hypothetical protein